MTNDLPPVEKLPTRKWDAVRVFVSSTFRDMQAERDRMASFTDWTYTDEEGRRWGVSPEGLHLGDVTIPIPLYFGASPGKRLEMEQRALDLADLNRAASYSEIVLVREALYEQGLAARRRMKADRDTLRFRR